MLIDVWREVGLDGMAQVDLEEHRNRHQPLLALTPMADTVLATIAARLEREGRLQRAGLGVPDPPRARAAAAREPPGRVSGAANVRCLYLDLDGTLLGRGASMLHDGEGHVTIEGVRAVQACLRAGVEVVLMSGRRRAQVAGGRAPARPDDRSSGRPARAWCWRARSTG